MDLALVLLLLVILTALVFEFINGFHDTANSIATVVGDSTLVATTVAMELAVSWNPLMNSNTNAVMITSSSSAKARSMRMPS